MAQTLIPRTNVVEQKLDQNLEQSVANAKGIAKLNNDMNNHHTETMASLSSLQKSVSELHEEVSMLGITIRNGRDSTLNSFDNMKKRHDTLQKLVIIFGSIITSLLLVIAIFLFYNDSTRKSSEEDSQEKNAIIAIYEDMIRQYGMELPEFPEFPDLGAYGIAD